MQPDVKKRLDRERLRYHLSNVKVVLIIALVLAAFVGIGYGIIHGKKSFVTGSVVSLHASVHEEGHDLMIMVKTAEQDSLIRVKIPKSANIGVDDQVILRKTQTLFLGANRYRYSRLVTSETTP